jgi:hypothetical protein
MDLAEQFVKRTSSRVRVFGSTKLCRQILEAGPPGIANGTWNSVDRRRSLRQAVGGSVRQPDFRIEPTTVRYARASRRFGHDIVDPLLQQILHLPSDADPRLHAHIRDVPRQAPQPMFASIAQLTNDDDRAIPVPRRDISSR